MPRIFKFTKFKLIIGYLLLLLLAASAIVFIYKQTLKLSAKDDTATINQQKLFLISNTLTKLYEAEGIGIAFSQTVSKRQYNAYTGLMNEVRKNMDTLRGLVSIELQQFQIDTINHLLKQKEQNIKELLAVKQENISSAFYNRATETLEHLKDTTVTDIEVQERIITKTDTIYGQERSWLFGKPKTIVKEVKESRERIFDTIPRQTTLKTDTIIHTIKTVLDEFEDERLRKEKEVDRKELAVIQSGQHLTEQIRRILTAIEEEEVNYTLSKIEERQEIITELTKTIPGIAIIACILAILFVSLIFNDISRSQRYRKELEEANLFAEKLLKGRERLMLTVSHDIKSPLNSITGYTELLDTTSLSERQHYYLANMKSSAQHILQLVNNLLEYSKLESGKMEFDSINYKPAKLLQETIDSFIPQATQKELKLNSHISQALDTEYTGDPLKIRQIIVNLLSNAIKYTRKGKIELSAFLSEKQGQWMTIVIKDTGSGMTEEEQHIIFEEFTRLSGQHNDGAEGTGLGLTITRQLIELMGGSISLSSKKGEGSTFTVRLPLIKANDQNVLSPTDTILPPPAIRYIKILIVDDDPLQLTMCSDLLRQNGMETVTCEDPLKVTELLNKESVDMLLSDIQMPGLDGFSLIKMIRQSSDDYIRTLPAIALSARDDISEQEYIRSGFSAYINKPFTPGKLLECISRLSGVVVSTTPEDTANEDPDCPFSLKSIAIFADNDPLAIRKIVDSFIADCHSNFLLLKKYSEQSDYENLSKLAHKMLPMFKQFAILQIVPLLSKLEKMDPSVSSADEIIQLVNEVINIGKDIIEQLHEADLNR